MQHNHPVPEAVTIIQVLINWGRDGSIIRFILSVITSMPLSKIHLKFSSRYCGDSKCSIKYLLLLASKKKKQKQKAVSNH
jgi:hypothetical protein